MACEGSHGWEGSRGSYLEHLYKYEKCTSTIQEMAISTSGNTRERMAQVDPGTNENSTCWEG